MPRITRLPAALAARGLTVELVDGWEVRGSADFDPQGAVCHWTAGARTGDRPSLKVVRDGRPKLPGPLANVLLARSGVAVVVAAGRANHAGEGGWRGLTGNRSVWGTEAESAGDGDWTDAQRWAYPRINAAYCDLSGFGPDMVCGHNEWAPNRKIDIRDWDMAHMRREVTDLLTGGGFLMALSEQKQQEMYDRIMGALPGKENGRARYPRVLDVGDGAEIVKNLGYVRDQLAGFTQTAITNAVQALPGTDPDTIAAAITAAADKAFAGLTGTLTFDNREIS
ncbi:N-acetylmuramoyl-L-alanine amidase [Cellulosimicrobium cellulans]|uniref:N-acetylmuramoyl-L-alanine amidase n=1 Tax=Cellulosimicrobium cellulans TaxID=1710 RepID=UPI0019663E9C|nr:N-acetylmuramoyl-L-alanine amidase [Cellulosimicrobium cellulans]MBN0039397.1 N-acetylmuramoyl-L-alanine amidase [Cellulosimicrobium cellulans]